MKCSLPIGEISQLQQTIYENNSKLYPSVCQSICHYEMKRLLIIVMRWQVAIISTCGNIIWTTYFSTVPSNSYITRFMFYGSMVAKNKKEG